MGIPTMGIWSGSNRDKPEPLWFTILMLVLLGVITIILILGIIE